MFGARKSLTTINQDPQPDPRQLVENCLSRLIATRQLGFTVFFDKPVSLFSIYKERGLKPEEPVWDAAGCRVQAKVSREEWEAVMDVIGPSLSPDFLIREYQIPSQGSTSAISRHMTYGVVFNRPACKSLISRHLDIFQRVLQRHESAADILEVLVEEPSLESALKESNLLTGLMLGYGLDASQAFQDKRTDLADSASVEETITDPVRPVFFKYLPDSRESADIVRKFEEQRKLLIAIHNSGQLTREAINILTGQTKTGSLSW